MALPIEEVRRRNRERMRIWRENNKDLALERARKWRVDNPERQKAINARGVANYNAKHPERRREANEKWRLANLDKVRDRRRQRNYGITKNEWEWLFEEQERLCAICRTDTPTGRGWNTDHCHKSRKVRGILCRRCNLLIGHLEKNEDILDDVLRYIERHRYSD